MQLVSLFLHHSRLVLVGIVPVCNAPKLLEYTRIMSLTRVEQQNPEELVGDAPLDGAVIYASTFP